MVGPSLVIQLRTRGARITNNFVYHVTGDAVALVCTAGSLYLSEVAGYRLQFVLTNLEAQ